MRNLETFVNEKLRVTKGSDIPNLISFLESKTKKEFESKCKQLLEYLKNDSGLPMAELEVRKTGFKKLLREYKNGYDTFLVIIDDTIFFGEWSSADYVSWNVNKGRIEIVKLGYGFSSLATTDEEISKYGGVYIITENSELMKQINYLMQKAEQYS